MPAEPGIGPRVPGCRFVWLALWMLAGALPAQGGARGPSDGLTGDWGGLRSGLADSGIRMGVVYTGEIFADVSGGAHRGTVYPGNVDLTLTLDARKLLGWPETTFFVFGLGTLGGNPSKNVGDAQGVSDIAAYNTWKLYEAWVQRNFPRLRLSVLEGFYELNSEFDTLSSAGTFLNASHGIDPTLAFSGPGGPSIFPTTTLGLRLKWNPAPSVYLQTIVLNGVAGNPDNPRGTQLILSGRYGVLWTTEVGYLLRPVTAPASAPPGNRRLGRFGAPGYDAKIAVGVWYYTAAQVAVHPPAEPGKRLHESPGLYVIGEKSLHAEPAASRQGLTAFARLGLADPRANRFAFYAGGGLIYRGLLPRRDNDVIGVAVAAAFNGNEYRQAQAGHPADCAETNIELTYRTPLTRRISIQPDLQYVFNPDTDPGRPNALAIDVRMVVDF